MIGLTVPEALASVIVLLAAGAALAEIVRGLKAKADKVREYKRKWYQEHRKPKYPLGMVVWIKEGPWWLEGTIVEKPNNSTIIVKVRGSGRLVRTAGRWAKSENPNAWERVA